MKVLITGGSGFIGSRLVEVLSKGGNDVNVLSRHISSTYPAGVNIMKGDLSSPACPLDRYVEGCDIVFHCAGEVYETAKMRSLHVDGTGRLLHAVLNEAARKKHSIHWIQLSSIGAYGYPNEYIHVERVVTEDSPTQPCGEYEITKTISDELVMRAADSELISFSIIRPSKVFGAGKRNPSLYLLGEAVRKRLFFYIGPTGAIATYVHVDDVVGVLERCAMDVRAKGEIFNVSNDCLLEAMVDGIASSVGVPPPRLRLPESLVRGAVRVVDTLARSPLTQEQISGLVRRTKYPYEKLRRELGFVPRISVPEAIGEAALTK